MGYRGPRLLDQVGDKCRRKNYSIRTEQAYMEWVKRFVLPSTRYIQPAGQTRVLA